MKQLVLILLLTISIRNLAANETCSRTAIINYQEVQVDTSSTRKGEGLRFYLSRDKVAESLLNKYQDRSSPKWYTTALSTFGTAMIIAGLLQSGKDRTEGFSRKEAFYIGGATTIAVSYLITKTFEINNEKYLQMSIEEYNRRNLPRIFFSPYNSSIKGKKKLGIGAGFSKEF